MILHTKVMYTYAKMFSKVYALKLGKIPLKINSALTNNPYTKACKDNNLFDIMNIMCAIILH